MGIPDQYHNQKEMRSHQRNQNLTRLFVVVTAHLQPKFIDKKKSDCILIYEENIISLCQSIYFRVLTIIFRRRSVWTGYGRKTREITGKGNQEYEVHIRSPIFRVSEQNRPELSINSSHIPASKSSYIPEISSGNR
jgi:hypothetical protein